VTEQRRDINALPKEKFATTVVGAERTCPGEAAPVRSVIAEAVVRGRAVDAGSEAMNLPVRQLIAGSNRSNRPVADIVDSSALPTGSSVTSRSPLPRCKSDVAKSCHRGTRLIKAATERRLLKDFATGSRAVAEFRLCSARAGNAQSADAWVRSGRGRSLDSDAPSTLGRSRCSRRPLFEQSGNSSMQAAPRWCDLGKPTSALRPHSFDEKLLERQLAGATNRRGFV
jgi:hypothetical protein